MPPEPTDTTAPDRHPEHDPTPWTLHLTPRPDGSPREMLVTAEDGAVVEHRIAGGFTPAQFAAHIANARHYVTTVNRAHKTTPDEGPPWPP